MSIFSGRLDQWAEEEEVILWFILFTETFGVYESVLTFEDQTKSGIDCKPHYHFVIRTSKPYSHDRIRRWMSKLPDLTGTKSSLKSVPDKELDKAYKYILKQVQRHQYIPFYDMDEDKLIALIEDSRDYNDNKVKVNKWKDHMQLICQEIKEKYKDKYPDRREILEAVGEYIYKYNEKQQGVKLTYPVNLRSTIHYIESEILDQKEFMVRFLLDNDNLIYEHDIKNFCRDTKITKIRTAKLSSYFEDSDEE